MTTARTFVRFAFAGLFANALAVACVVNSDDSDNDDNTPCDAGTHRDCTCSDGSMSQRTCNPSGSGFGVCDCDGSSGGGTSNAGGGAGDQAGEGNTTAGKGGTGGTSYGGEPNVTGGAPTNEAGAPAANGGAGGTGEVDPGLCAEDPNDSCADCYQQGCCAEWTACVDDDDCLTEFTGIIACAEGIRADHNVTTAEFEACAADESPASGGWASGVSALTVDMVNCVAGEEGWEGSPWGNLACKAGCFDK